MATDPQIRIRYVTFALFAQRVVDVLIDFVEQGDEGRLNATLEEAIERLLAATPAGEAASTQKGIREFSNYEQVRTVCEVFKDPEIQGMIGTLTDLLARRGTKRAQRRSADQAIEFFSALENRALRVSDEPEPAPRGIRELCEA